MGGMMKPSQTQTESLPEGGQRLRNFGFNQMFSNMGNPQTRGPGASMGGAFGQSQGMMGGGFPGMGMGGGPGPGGPVPPGPFGFGGGMGMAPPTMGGPGGGMPPAPGEGGMGMRPPGGGMGGLQGMMSQLQGLQGAPAGGAPNSQFGQPGMGAQASNPGMFGGGGGPQPGGTPFGGMANAGGPSPPMGLPGIPGAPQNTRGPGGGAPAGRDPFGAGAFPQGPVSGSRMAQSFQPSFQNQQVQEPGGGGRPQTREDFMNPPALDPGSNNPFDMAQFGGPFAAPMNPMQMDALGGFQQAMQNNPLVSTGMMQQGLQEGAGGFNTFDPSGGQTLEGRLDPFQTPSGADQFMANLFGGSPFGSQGVQPTEGNPGTLGPPGDGSGAEGEGGFGAEGGSRGGFGEEIIGQLTPDIIDSFRQALDPPGARTGQGRSAMDAAVGRAMQGARSEASGMGLNPGAINRGQLMAGSAADVAAKLGIQQQQADTGSLSARQQNQVGALNAARGLGDFFNTGAQNKLMREGNQISALPSLLQRENRGFNQFLQTQEPAAQRMMQTLGMLPEFRQQPLNERAQQFGLGEAARGIGDVDLQRQMQEFARTQGGGLQQMISLLGGVPGINTAFGPSGLSQVGSFIQGAGSAAAAASGGGG